MHAQKEVDSTSPIGDNDVSGEDLEKTTMSPVEEIRHQMKIEDLTFTTGPTECVEGTVVNVTEDDSVGDVVVRVGELLKLLVDQAALLEMMGGEFVVGSICKLQAGATLKAEPEDDIVEPLQVVLFVCFVLFVDCGICFFTFGVQFRILFSLVVSIERGL